jgi:hypothetical protein
MSLGRCSSDDTSDLLVLYDIIPLTKSTLLTADTILLCTKKNVYSPTCLVPPPSHLTSCTPTKSNLYLDSYLEIVIREPAPYKLLIFHNPNLMSLFHRLGHLSRESIQVQGTFMTSVTNLFVYSERFVSPTSNPQAGGPPLVLYMRLLVQYICSYPPLMEFVPPSATRGHVMLW